MKNNFLKLFLTFVFFACMFTSVMAQVTTSGMSGRVTGSDEALPGAAIIAVHVPSGTQYGTITNAEGRFNLQGMRTGGPYEVRISFVGFNTAVFSEINLSLGETFALNTNLKDNTMEVGEVTVIGMKPSAFSTEKTGASSNITSKTMEMIPSMNRSLGDYTKLSPFTTGGGSYVGREAYTTNVTVDGANFNNNFGLSGSSMPGVSGEPISMDAIEEIQVAVAPYDVRQSNFTGAGINAVTKSGTNTVKGSVYTFYRDQSFNGDKVGDKPLTVTNSSKKVYGFNAGGPIIKDKLFFFVSGEMENSLYPGNTLLAQDTGRDPATDTNVSNYVKATDLKDFSSYLKTKLNYETGLYESWGGDEEKNDKILAKLDWNINQNNKFSIRYNYSKSSNVSRPSSSGDASPSISGGRHSRTGGMSFQNSQYYNTSTMQSLTGELNSRFGQFQNKLLVAYTKYNQPRSSDSSTFPFIDIMSGDATKGNVYMSAGYELFSWQNNVDNNTFIATDNVTYSLEKHTLTGGISYEHQYFANSYLRQGSGYYRFRDLAAFKSYVNGDGLNADGTNKPFNASYDPINFAYTYPINGYEDPAAKLSFGQLSSYVQDEWNAIENLKVTAGIRIDIPMYLSGAVDNPGLNGQRFKQNETVDLSTWPTVKVLWSPRLGFNWDVKGDKSLKIRGGTGIFTGRIPFVWFTNQPTNSGMLQYQYVVNQSGGATSQSQLSRIPFEADAKNLLSNPAIADIFPQKNVVGGRIAAIDKNFKLPQVWRTSIGFDLKLPLNMMLSMDGIYTKDINSIWFENINMNEAASTIKEGDNTRPYWSNSTNADKYYNKTFQNVVIMRNTKKGDGYTLSAQLDLPKFKGFSGMLGYSRNMGHEVTGKSGSDPFSAWQYRVIKNSSNDLETGLTANNTPHRFFAEANYTIEYAKYFATTLSVFYSAYQGGAYQYLYNSDMNKDGTSGHELMYIPKSQSELLWASQADADAYFAFAKQDPYLSKHSGEYAERWAAYTPWNKRLDIRLMQDFKLKYKNTGNKLQFTVDVINFANLLNSSWGLNQDLVQSNPTRSLMPLSVVGKDPATGMLKVSMQKIAGEYIKTSYQDPTSVAGTYGIQLGLRYVFN
ncbi:MAG TPA: TonB-dependent receptor [Prolixibacteraceae bacterium]|nr:TonB-dependent receptor [Prolixibacteraceae bacterium]